MEYLQGAPATPRVKTRKSRTGSFGCTCPSDWVRPLRPRLNNFSQPQSAPAKRISKYHDLLAAGIAGNGSVTPVGISMAGTILFSSRLVATGNLSDVAAKKGDT
jgi:hypothetical protein